jgi:hypothetical protein
MFWCPACKEAHNFDVSEGQWRFDGDWDNPTFQPSLALPHCHLFVEKGEIKYCHDAKHELAGKCIPMQDFPE